MLQIRVNRNAGYINHRMRKTTDVQTHFHCKQFSNVHKNERVTTISSNRYVCFICFRHLDGLSGRENNTFSFICSLFLCSHEHRNAAAFLSSPFAIPRDLCELLGIVKAERILWMLVKHYIRMLERSEMIIRKF